MEVGESWRRGVGISVGGSLREGGVDRVKKRKKMEKISSICLLGQIQGLRGQILGLRG